MRVYSCTEWHCNWRSGLCHNRTGRQSAERGSLRDSNCGVALKLRHGHFLPSKGLFEKVTLQLGPRMAVSNVLNLSGWSTSHIVVKTFCTSRCDNV